mmetsp:Transcript_19900/g.64079  ORF Transcript_19900/g.64079 Transcript_19900/m.64079 type:complete len:165 (+) Transcript_19900:669-1163(+)
MNERTNKQTTSTPSSTTRNIGHSAWLPPDCSAPPAEASGPLPPTRIASAPPQNNYRKPRRRFPPPLSSSRCALVVRLRDDSCCGALPTDPAKKAKSSCKKQAPPSFTVKTTLFVAPPHPLSHRLVIIHSSIHSQQSQQQSPTNDKNTFTTRLPLSSIPWTLMDD